MNGILVLNKPSGPTSRDEVNRVQPLLPKRTKLGHAGTLDPLASGVLVLAIGDATRLVEYLQDLPKAYRTLIRLGATSTTDDAAGAIVPYSMVTYRAHPDEIADALANFRGTIEQTPPDYSAVKLAGRRAHDLARRNREFDIAPRPVRIDAIEVIRYEWPYLELRIDCGKGTYIRSLARDIGAKLGCGGYVETLERERIGPFALADALPIHYHREMVRRAILPMALAVGHIPKITVTEAEVAKLFDGQFLVQTELPDTAEVALFDAAGFLRALGAREAGVFQPRKVFKN